MGAVDNNKFPKVIFQEIANDGSDLSNPAADHRALFLGEDGNLHLKDSAGSVTSPGGGAAVTGSEARLSGNVTMTNANQFYDGPSISLAAGTYVINGKIEVTRGGGQAWVNAKLWDGTTVYDSAESFIDTDGAGVSLSFSKYIVLGSTTTVKISAAATTTGGTIRATPTTNATGETDTACAIVALKIA